MSIAHILYVAGGAAAAGVVSSLGKDGLVHRGAVKVATACLHAADKVTSVTQSIVDEAVKRGLMPRSPSASPSLKRASVRK